MDIAAEVVSRASQYGGSNPQQQEFMLSRLRSLPAEKVVPALLSIFTRRTDPESEESIQEQQLAGYLLLHGHHGCPLPLRETLVAALDGWNVSIEELPWYLAREFGREAVMLCVGELLEQLRISEQHQRSLRTVGSWVRNNVPSAQEL